MTLLQSVLRGEIIIGQNKELKLKTVFVIIMVNWCQLFSNEERNHIVPKYLDNGNLSAILNSINVGIVKENVGLDRMFCADYSVAVDLGKPYPQLYYPG